MKARIVRFANAVMTLMLVLTTTSVVAGTVLYVDLRAPFGTTDHQSWETAYNCLQAAVQDAHAGDEIRVAQGTYQPDRTWAPSGRSGIASGISASGSRSARFEPRNGVVMKGGYAGLGAPDPNARDLDAHPSILSGDLQGNDADLTGIDWQTLADFTASLTLSDNSYTVVSFSHAFEDTVLDGFVITGAYEDRGKGSVDDNGFIVPGPGGRSTSAGAMWISDGSPTVTRCTFYRNVARAQDEDCCGGPALLCAYSQPTFLECSFVENVAFADGITSTGGAVLNIRADPNFLDCSFIDNVAMGQNGQYVGGAMANFYSSPNLIDCSFAENGILGADSDTDFMAGGAVFHHGSSSPVLTNCAFIGNVANLGGAFYGRQECAAVLTDCSFEGNLAGSSGGAFSCTSLCEPVLKRCLFLANSAAGAGFGGAVSAGCDITAVSCRFLGNRAAQGGAWRMDARATLTNCLFSGNTAARGAAISSGTSAILSAVNCTFSNNHSGGNATTYDGSARSEAEFVNCIMWDDEPLDDHMSSSEVLSIRYSDVKGSGWSLYNIDEDPRFQDPLGPDGVAGTLDDNLRLSLGSPCLDAGHNPAIPPGTQVDLDGQRRVSNLWVDMGAYEFYGPFNYYVDAVNGDDDNGGWAPHEAFATIQRAIDAASDGYQVFVLPGTYTEEINFSGKAITVAGYRGAPLLEAPDGYAVSFYTAETPASVLRNFAIRGSDVGIFLAGASPTIRNVTVADNKFGIAAYAGSRPEISNCILWGNAAGDLFDCSATYSCIERPAPGEGNISADPLFGDPANGDYHLTSEGGRYVAMYGLWAFDTVTSPCVDAGNPSLDPGDERMPNGGRINMGAFGGTPQASISLCIPCMGP